MEDFLRLESELQPEERLIRDTVRQFVASDVIPLMADAYETAQFPHPLIPKLAGPISLQF